MKETLGTLVRLSGVDRLVRFARARRKVTVVVYHNPKPEILREHLAYYARRYSFTTLDAVADALETGRWDALPAYPLVVTLDDGHRGNLALEAVFREYGVRPTIYLCSQVVGTARPFWWQTAAADELGAAALKTLPDEERRRRLARAGDDPDRDAAGPLQAMSWEEARHLGAVADYGGHTRTHPILIRCDDARAREEIALCRGELEEALARPCAHFAYPNGDYGEREVALLRQAGYRTGRSIEAGWNGPDADPFRLKAFPIVDDISVGWLAAQLTGIPARLRALKASMKGGLAEPTGYPSPTPGRTANAYGVQK